METEILFNQPSFINGAARTLDLWGIYSDYNNSFSTNEADNLALSADIIAVEKDFKAAHDICIATFEKEFEKDK
jgi:hypothetical protein